LHAQRHRHAVRIPPRRRTRTRRAPCRGDRRLRSLDAGRLTVRGLVIPLLVLALAACNRDAPEPEAIETEVPEELVQDAPPVTAGGDSIGTPMEERVATLGLL